MMQKKKNQAVGGEGQGWVTEKTKQKDEEEGRNQDGQGDKNSTWQDLPAELLELILQKLGIMDYLQCRTVCSSWRIMVNNAIASKCCRPAPQSPFALLFPPGYSDEDIEDYHLLSPSEDRLYPVRSKWPTDVTCVGSIEGWLIMKFIDYSNEDVILHGFTYFLNPVSDTTIVLPTTSISSRSKANPESGTTFFSKVVASSVPDFPECHVATLLCCMATRKQQLAYCRVSDKSWKVINYPQGAGCFFDLAFYDDKLYSISMKPSDFVMVFDLGNPNAVITRLVMLDPKPVPRVGVRLIKNDHEHWTGTERIFLVKDTTRDELLLVFQLLDFSTTLGCELSRGFVLPPQTKGFRVFTMDKSGPRWMEVDNLGDRSIFLDNQSSKVISTANLNSSMESIKGNCIYFAHYFRCSEDPSLARDIGVFSLTDRSIKHFALDSSFKIQAPILWFTPCPW